jgi:hypothetical protein
MSLYSVLESILLMAAIIFTILGNILSDLLYILLGTLLGFVAFVGALYLTLRVKKDAGVDDVIFINALIYPLIIAIILTIGSINIGLSQYRAIWFDLALIIAVFIAFTFLWIILRQKWKFLTLENVDFITPTDKEKYPQFFLSNLILGFILGMIFILMKLFYIWFGYEVTSYIVMIFTLVITLMLAFFLRPIIKKIKERPQKPRKEKA